MQYAKLYQIGKEQLQKAGITDAELDARLLLEFICHTDRNALYAHGDLEIEDEKMQDFLQLIEKRATHIPLQHLTGEQNFMGLDFLVNEHVLIPRQDTEILVEEIMRDLHDGIRILDMCTGSGCILLSLLHYSNDCSGVGVDVSEDALAVARQNADRLAEKQAVFIQSDLFEKVEGSFDLIVSNPPYIRSQEIAGLMPEVREHEPHLALDGKEDGLYFYREIIKGAEHHLKRGGQLFFEIGYDQGEAVKALLVANGYTEVAVVKDYAGLDRVVYGTFLGGSSNV
ncbi:peptide chain release factor N(5)-glutamine methyltransferase [Kineothrix sp. MSJ-39]|uniref:peptide chain release factor N(5)-glutamine methyltransferase n=1 Tax=Kineothrix sp. MSJ-39 TaxID=2841533 RepID=UPI001C11DB89|nr:peptide chain release factor N(5)-glutamine methyltransferase [Kineothrix sp. MSJ-39]MBU5429952.1 peptide chain release factor N(5)-glutamine methyltransferase [Kineothrix sp. MSJ-39]